MGFLPSFTNKRYSTTSFAFVGVEKERWWWRMKKACKRSADRLLGGVCLTPLGGSFDGR